MTFILPMLDCMSCLKCTKWPTLVHNWGNIHGQELGEWWHHNVSHATGRRTWGQRRCRWAIGDMEHTFRCLMSQLRHKGLLRSWGGGWKGRKIIYQYEESKFTFKIVQNYQVNLLSTAYLYKFLNTSYYGPRGLLPIGRWQKLGLFQGGAKAL